MPCSPLPSPAVPEALRPIQLPAMAVVPARKPSSIPVLPFPLMTLPEMLEPDAPRVDDFDLHVAPAGPVSEQALRQDVAEAAVDPDQTALVVLEVQVPRAWLKRHGGNVRGVWRCTRDVPVSYIRRVIDFDQLAASPVGAA